MLLLVILNSFYIMAVEREPDGLDCYNVVWDAPSRNALESMPCGAGDIRRIELIPEVGATAHIFVSQSF